MSGRKPRQDELELWAKVAGQTQPLPKALAPKPVPPPKLPMMSVEPRRRVTEQVFRLTGKMSQRAHDFAPDVKVRMAAQPVQMDRKSFKQMQRGKLRPEGRIDLHGMTLDRAHSALTRFILSSHSSGKRLLLIITGKGKNRDHGGPIPVRNGVLRHQVPEWLRLPPLSSAVLQITEAHISHGGGGAYYVYLRRTK
ncbi:MAG: Smr/MutS family protein [Aliishimia sp.]